jgi:hypothetical protein
MTALATRLEGTEVTPEIGAPASQLTPMQMAYQLVARGADFAAVREMIEFGKKLEADEAEKAFNVAMTECQAEMRPVAANSYNKQTKSKYATYDALDAQVREIYTRHGFSPSFDSGDGAPPDHVRVLCYLAHRGGHTRTYKIDMPADGKGAKGGDVMTKTHATSSAFSYGQRYLLGLMFNLAISGKRDDDGNAAGRTVGEPLITADQVNELRKLIEEAGTTAEKFCEVGDIDAIPDMYARNFDVAKNWLKQRIAARSAKAPPKVDPRASLDRMEGQNGR